jgi:molecular chaperone GrpE (heat shock protein)
MDERFPIDEQPLPVPNAAVHVDLAVEIGALHVRCHALEQRLEAERREAQAVQRAFLLGLLEVADALERIAGAVAPDPGEAAERQRRSLQATRRLLAQKLGAAGVTRMDLVGQPADPHLADIVDQGERADLPAETVTHEVVGGYWWGDAVLRRAQVCVSRRG